MSKLYAEDVVRFNDDPAITGTVECTWSETDNIALEKEVTACYRHKTVPRHIDARFLATGELSPGYVLVHFMEDYDGYCLVSEDALILLDRALAVGDAVKKSASAVESGVVISTSIVCELRPLCTEADYNAKDYVPAEKHSLKQETRVSGPIECDSRKHFAALSEAEHCQSSPLPDAPSDFSPRQVSAQDLAYWDGYREGDFIIYQQFVGQIDDIVRDISIRLANGSVVVVEDAEELEQVPGIASFELSRRLERAGYRKFDVSEDKNPLSDINPSSICPGDRVQTKKGNLRRGEWKFGAYDPTVAPQGIVVDARTIQLEVHWICPNQSLSLRRQAAEPPTVLGTDEIESGQIQVYDRSRLSKVALFKQLPDASYSRDVGYGNAVRFKDPTKAAVKYPYIENIPRVKTQGFDMNVLQVCSTTTLVKVRWQDVSETVETSTILHPYLNIDEHDLWPGDRVSLKAEEEQPDSNDPGSLKARKVGVVQEVDALNRMACVRWYIGALFHIDVDRGDQVHGSEYGPIGEEISQVSLYDVATYPALTTCQGDLAVVIPNTVSTYNSSIWRRHSASGPAWFGEIVDTCPDGDVIVRMGLADEVYDIKVSADRILLIPSEDEESDSEHTDESDNMVDNISSRSDTEAHGHLDSVIKVSYLDEDGNEMMERSDEDASMWTTDEEDGQGPGVQQPLSGDHTAMTKSALEDDTVMGDASFPTEPLYTHRHDASPITFSNYQSMPSRYSLLECSPPADHHYANVETPLTADLMRRIQKDNSILQTSLPDGVFVRSWDSRLDLLRILIVGPCDTPYEFSPFVFDLQYGASFPASPPDIFFHSWANSVGRINPNLYTDGKICLSLLGTWMSENRHEEWSSKKSTILQVLVSILGLVLVKEPYYNEAGFEVLIGSEESKLHSSMYNEKAYVASKAYIKTALTAPPLGLADITQWLYTQSDGPNLLSRVIKDSRLLLPENIKDRAGELGDDVVVEQGRLRSVSTGALVLLRRNLAALEEIAERKGMGG